MRIHELAKELGIESKELVAYLAENGIDVKAASAAKEDAIALANKKYGKKKAAASASETEEIESSNSISGQDIKMGNDIIPVGRTRKKAFMEALNKYMSSHSS